MEMRRELEKRIEKKRQEVADLELKIAEARAYTQALQDMLKVMPRDPQIDGSAPGPLRAGSEVSLAKEAIHNAGKPLYIEQLLEAIGKPVTKENKVSLSTSLAGYVRRGAVFTRPLPNTFGLIEFPPVEQPSVEEEELPADFGADDGEEELSP